MKNSLRCAVAVAVCALAGTAADAAVVTPGQLARPEGPRHYLLAAPEHIAPGKHPLVILLHGHAGSAEPLVGRERRGMLHSALSVWMQIADREQLIVIAPDGAKGSDGHSGWNDCRSDAPTNPKTDDVGFLNALIDKAIAENDADPARIYVMGMSNGGIMTLRMAVESGARLAAFAAMGASMPARSRCAAPAVPLSALIIAGTADPIVPYAGGEVRVPMIPGRGSVIGVEESAAAWRQLDRLPAAATTTGFAHRDESGDTRATRMLWGSDPHKLQVELIKVENGGHTEPSITRRHRWPYRLILGAQNADFEVAEEAWAFFKDKKAGTLP